MIAAKFILSIKHAYIIEISLVQKDTVLFNYILYEFLPISTILDYKLMNLVFDKEIEMNQNFSFLRPFSMNFNEP